MKRCIAIFALLGLIAANPATAQQAGELDAEPEAGVAGAVSSAERENDSDQAAAPGPAASENASSAPPTEEDSPFDYQASEQISEDLSVSFPVDI